MNHFAQHPWHMLGCVVAAVFVAAAVIFTIPILATFGALMCAAMMLMMMWLMFSMMGRR